MYVYDYDKFFMNILPLIYLNDKCCLCLVFFCKKLILDIYIFFGIHILVDRTVDIRHVIMQNQCHSPKTSGAQGSR